MSPTRRTAFLLFLAAIFTIGLTFATVELPYLVDDYLQRRMATPDIDSHVDAVNVLKTELFIAHYRLRLIGYVCFALLVGLIFVGFATRRTGLAAAGAVGFMLPVFAQFASVMFFLSGLGALNVLWLPVLDISFDVQQFGLIVRAPYDLLRWLFRQAGVNGYWPTVYTCLGGGGLIFFLGTYAWLAARAGGRAVADFWVYRLSRHPQYLGWMLWSYGVYLLLLRLQYPRRSWGIDASLPWLVSTLAIIAVAMLEEVDMRRRHGEAYEVYRRATPFLFPVPRVVARAFAWPTNVLFKKDVPDRRREVAVLVPLYAVTLMAASAFLYGRVGDRVREVLRPSARTEARVGELSLRIQNAAGWRARYALAEQMVAFGDPAIDEFLDLLRHQDIGVRRVAAEFLRQNPRDRAIPALVAALADSVADVRVDAIRALAAIGSSTAVDPLMSMLDDSVGWVRSTALRTLATLGADEVIGRVAPWLADSSVLTRISTIESLGVLGSADAVPLLVGGAIDSIPAVRRATVAALVKIGSARGRTALLQGCADPDWEVRLYACEGLKRLGR